MGRKQIDKLVDLAKTYGAKGLAYLCVNEDGTYKSSFAKFMTEEELAALVEAMEGSRETCCYSLQIKISCMGSSWRIKTSYGKRTEPA